MDLELTDAAKEPAGAGGFDPAGVAAGGSVDFRVNGDNVPIRDPQGHPK